MPPSSLKVQPTEEESAGLRARPRQRRSQARVQKILDTAAELIVRHGRAKVSAVMVAEAAGLPVGSIYQYFANMEAVATALAERAMFSVDEAALAVARDFDPAGDPMGMVSDIIDAVLRRYADQPGAIGLMQELRHTQGFQEAAARSDAQIGAAFAEILHQRLPGVPFESITAYVTVATTMAGGLQLLVWRTPEGPAREAVIREWKLTAGGRLAALVAEAAVSPSAAKPARRRKKPSAG